MTAVRFLIVDKNWKSCIDSSHPIAFGRFFQPERICRPHNRPHEILSFFYERNRKIEITGLVMDVLVEGRSLKRI